MIIQILESKFFSLKSQKNLKKIGKLYLGKINKNKKKRINILYVRFKYFIGKDFLKEYSSLKYIISPTTGLDHIDIKFCKTKNIKILYLGNIKEKIKKIYSTADLCLGLIFSLARNINFSSKLFVKKNFLNRYDFITNDLRSQIVGIIGKGRIGSAVQKYLRLLKIKTLIVDIKNKDNYQTKLKKLFKKADIISINASVRNNKKIIDHEEIKIMKKGVKIVNTARASLVNENAIVRGIQNKKISGYATDVIDNEIEPKKIAKSQLIKLAKKDFNIIITPHIGGCTYESINKTEDLITEYLIKKIIQNKINISSTK